MGKATHKTQSLDWLVQISDSSKNAYRHRRFDEDIKKRSQTISELQNIVSEAHSDAVSYFESLIGKSLDPLKQENPDDPKIEYPQGLHLDNLKGYFGEILAANIIMHKDPFDKNDWLVPAFRFRMHNVAFEKLFASAQKSSPVKKIPGLTGEDCIAIRVNDQYQLLEFLVCEAKCTKGHDSSMITDAHAQVSDTIVPSILPQVIEILRSQSDDNSKLISLLQAIILRYEEHRSKRCNLVFYACGQRPKQKKSWIESQNPHESYKLGSRLEVAEIHLNDVDDLVAKSYKKTT